jgi:Transglycosylase SLT domain
MNQVGYFSTGTVPAAPSTAGWVVQLTGLALALATSTMVSASPFVVDRSAADAPLIAALPLDAGARLATSLATTPIEPEPSDRAADRTDAAGNLAAPGARSPMLRATNLGVSPLYGRAAARYGLDPRVLRALHQVESTAAGGGCLANRQGSGAIGPFQFKPATFRQYAVDADGDGQPSICGFADALFSAARYLQALGADARADSARTYRALVRYGTHAPRVVTDAIRLVR